MDTEAFSTKSLIPFNTASSSVVDVATDEAVTEAVVGATVKGDGTGKGGNWDRPGSRGDWAGRSVE